jgi:hypothetical protein
MLIFAGNLYTDTYDRGVPLRFLLSTPILFTYATIEGGVVLLTTLSGETLQVELAPLLERLESYIKMHP